jgi:hypothetical protein
MEAVPLQGKPLFSGETGRRLLRSKMHEQCFTKSLRNVVERIDGWHNAAALDTGNSHLCRTCPLGQLLLCPAQGQTALAYLETDFSGTAGAIVASLGLRMTHALLA